VRQRADQPSNSAKVLEQASHGAQEALIELHHIVNDLRPPALDQLGLIEALEEHVQAFSRLTGLLIEVEPVGDPEVFEALPTPVLDCLFRTVQECLNNVRKHAQASFVYIALDCSDPNCLVLEVSDDGVGIDASTATSRESFGQTSMRQRVTALGGTLEIRRGHHDDPDRGTTVKASIPLHRG